MTEISEQPMPTPNSQPDIQQLVIADIGTRREFGIERYGTALQPFNGRDALRDAYEEALDLSMYLRQAIEERTQNYEPVTGSSRKINRSWTRIRPGIEGRLISAGGINDDAYAWIDVRSER